MAGFPQALSSVLLLLLLILPGSAVAKVGYVSLNCGADGAGAFTDQQTGIRWVPDQAYISTGTSGVVSTAGLPQELQAVRYFPQYKKNCYKITVLPTFVYLIRAGFYYGNYDGFSSRRITFSLSLDNTPWETVDLTYNPAGLGKPTYIEAFTDGGPSTTLAVCLIREGRDVPFINSLEARLIDSSTAYTKVFEDEKIHMHLKGRANFGEKTATIRYPDDAWDRVWPPYVNEFPELSFVGTLTAPPNVTITNNVYSSRDEPPSIVMATALQGPVISYKRVIPPSSRIFASQYYAELNASLAPGDRRSIRWQASVADQSYIINITTAIQIYTTLEILLSGNLQVNDTVLAFTLDRDPERGTVNPILNAEELYTIHSVVLNATTQNDVDALLGIKRDLGLVQWVSDPCLPVAWDEVNCTAGVGTTSRITGLDLSRTSFSGPLPSTIAGLTSLETLLLNDNTFSGPLLDTFAGLTKLQTLNVANNSLSGPLPSWLESLTNLTVLDVSENNFTGTVPEALLSRPNLNFSYGGNQLVCSTPSCPPSPAPSPQNRPTTPPPPEQKKKKSNSAVVIVAAVGGIALIAIIAIVAVGVYCCCNRKPKEPSGASTTGMLPRVTPTTSTRKAPPPTIVAEVWQPSSSPVRSSARSSESMVNVLPDSPMGSKGKAKQFSLAEIKIATNDFRKQIGAGSFGPVYYGRFTDENQKLEVAVKVLSPTSVQGEKEFITEIEFLSMLHHKNLVHIVGFCQQGPERILIYEHMAGGDLGTRLHGPQVSERGAISWKDRLQIALDAAQGLEYLHHGCKPAIIHRDVKSSNILLSTTNEAKVSDFGLSKIMGQDGEPKSDTTIIKAGTVGHEYIDPEYFRTSFVTTESDVYSFGVILLELITGRSPISTKNRGVAEQRKPLVEWVHSLVQKADVATIADPLLAQHYDNASMWGLIEIAVRCTDASRTNRPSMAEVVKDLSRLGRRVQR